jgi:hypothetical protein
MILEVVSKGIKKPADIPNIMCCFLIAKAWYP